MRLRGFLNDFPKLAGGSKQRKQLIGGGRRVRDGEHMYTCGGFILLFGKTNTIM